MAPGISSGHRAPAAMGTPEQAEQLKASQWSVLPFLLQPIPPSFAPSEEGSVKLFVLREGENREWEQKVSAGNQRMVGPFANILPKPLLYDILNRSYPGLAPSRARELKTWWRSLVPDKAAPTRRMAPVRRYLSHLVGFVLVLLLRVGWEVGRKRSRIKKQMGSKN